MVCPWQLECSWYPPIAPRETLQGRREYCGLCFGRGGQYLCVRVVMRDERREFTCVRCYTLDPSDLCCVVCYRRSRHDVRIGHVKHGGCCACCGRSRHSLRQNLAQIPQDGTHRPFGNTCRRACLERTPAIIFVSYVKPRTVSPITSTIHLSKSTYIFLRSVSMAPSSVSAWTPHRFRTFSSCGGAILHFVRPATLARIACPKGAHPLWHLLLYETSRRWRGVTISGDESTL